MPSRKKPTPKKSAMASLKARGVHPKKAEAVRGGKGGMNKQTDVTLKRG
jgi:hypothetical protein